MTEEEILSDNAAFDDEEDYFSNDNVQFIDDIYDEPESQNQDENVLTEDNSDHLKEEMKDKAVEVNSINRAEEKQLNESQPGDKNLLINDIIKSEKEQILENKVDSIFESIVGLTQETNKMSSEINSSVRNQIIALAPRISADIKKSWQNDAAGINSTLRNSLNTLPEIDDWAKSTANNFRSLAETLESVKKDIKKSENTKTLKAGAIAILTAVCFTGGFFLAWIARGAFISYDKVFENYFNKYTEEIVEDKWQKKIKNAEAEAKQIILKAKEQSQKIISEANNQAAQIQTNSIMSQINK